jgi:hypothetical protein
MYDVPDADFVTQEDEPQVTFAVIVTPAGSVNPPPAVPPVARVVIVAHVNETLHAIAVLPLATRISDAASDAHVSHEPDPLAALFHWLTELMLTDEF